MLENLLVLGAFALFWGIPILIAQWIVKHKIDKGVKGWF